jgi:uncharacterized Zn finger protein
MQIPMLCPQCGHPSLEVREAELEELEQEFSDVKPPEKLQALECKECGWFGTRPHPIH